MSEGYCRLQRETARFAGSAADWLLSQLRATGRMDERLRRVVCEPFSRDIRGVSVNNSDVVLSRRFALVVAELATEGKSHLMPTVTGGGTGAIRFDKVETDNTVSPDDEKLANRL